MFGKFDRRLTSIAPVLSCADLRMPMCATSTSDLSVTVKQTTRKTAVVPMTKRCGYFLIDALMYPILVFSDE